MQEKNNLNMPILSIEKVVNILSESYCKIINNNISPKVFPSVMMWGAPGVGKSQAVRQIGKLIENKTHKKVVVIDVRLLLFNPIDLRGIPTANADKTLAIWLKPQIFQMDESDETINILFLDEISAAPPSVQAAAYQITLDRVVGEHKLPDNCIVIASGNRITDKSVAFKMPKALANRLLHIEIEGSFSSWYKWAIQNEIHKYVTGFLSFRRDKLFCFDSTNDDLAFATPRSWEMVSNILKNVSCDLDFVNSLISGLIGNALAIEFKAWCRIYSKLPDIEDIFLGKTRQVPKETDQLYALLSGMVAYAQEHSNDLFKIANSIKYASYLPVDYARMLLQSYQVMEPNYNDVITNMPEYMDLVRNRGDFLNGYVK